MFKTIDTSVVSTGNTLTGLWNTLSETEIGSFGRIKLEQTLKAEEKRRQDAFDLQRELTDQQIKLNDLKIEAYERGDAMITIDGAGMQPHLEAFMWAVIEAVQVRANADGAEFLLGV